MGKPVRPLCHREFPEGGGGVLRVCELRMVEVEAVDCSLGGRRPGLWGLWSPALALSGRRSGAWGLFAWWWALGWA